MGYGRKIKKIFLRADSLHRLCAWRFSPLFIFGSAIAAIGNCITRAQTFCQAETGTEAAALFRMAETPLVAIPARTMQERSRLDAACKRDRRWVSFGKIVS